VIGMEDGRDERDRDGSLSADDFAAAKAKLLGAGWGRTQEASTERSSEVGDLVADLERLSELHKAGILTADELKLAIEKRMASDEGGSTAPSAQLGGTVTCAHCHSHQDRSRRFCGNCSAPLFTVCPFCSTENALDSRFCQACRSDMTSSPDPGIALPLARQYRSQFEAIGWWDDPDINVAPNGGSLRSCLPTLHLATSPDDLNHYWIACCRVMKRTWGIQEVLLNRRAVATGWREKPVHYVVATRQELIFFNLNVPQASIGKYDQISGMELDGNRLNFTFRNLAIELHLDAPKGPSKLMRAGMIFGQDDMAAVSLMARDFRQGDVERASFFGVVNGFFVEVGKFAGLQWGG